MLNRRQFLRLATVAAAAFTVTRGTAASEEVEDQEALARPELLAVLGARAVRAIGRQYRGLIPAEDDPAILRRHLGACVVPAAIQDDFAAGRTVVLDGWVLSVTEARQCSLFSLRPA